MKKLTIIIAIVFSGIQIQAQSFTEVGNRILGTEINSYEDGKTREKTNYGTVLLKLKSKNNIVARIVISVSNDNQFYDEIVTFDTIAEIKVGSKWTDFTFFYEPIQTKKFKNLKDAKDYYNLYSNSKFEVHKEIGIYKYKKKGKYIVGRFIVDAPNSRILGDDGVPYTFSSFNNFEKVK